MSESGPPESPVWWVPPTDPASPPPPAQPTPPPPPPPGPPQYSPYVTYGYGGPTQAGPKTNGLAIASMVLGIVSIIGWFACMGLFTGVPGLVLGMVGLGQINRSGGRQGGRGMAIAGIVTSAIGVVGLVLLFVAGAVESP